MQRPLLDGCEARLSDAVHQQQPVGLFVSAHVKRIEPVRHLKQHVLCGGLVRVVVVSKAACYATCFVSQFTCVHVNLQKPAQPNGQQDRRNERRSSNSHRSRRLVT